MKLTVRAATNEDRAACLKVESSAIKGLAYLDDVWEYFASTKGELTCTLIDDEICGVGKFTVLPDNTAWLETLRVHQDSQGKGLGKAIYERYAEQAKEFGCTAMAMYTGVSNVVSAGLARKYGLEKTADFRGYVLENFDDGNIHSFQPVHPDSAWELVAPLMKQHGTHIVSNRTFYRFNEQNIKAFATENKVFHNPKSNSTIICGARFQENLALHILLMDGNLSECLNFAKYLATQRNVPKLICTFNLPNNTIENFLTSQNFNKEKSDLIVMDINL